MSAPTPAQDGDYELASASYPQEPGAVEFVQPGAKKAGDRISLPGGWYYERANDDGVIFVPRRPDGRGFGFEGNGKGLAVTVVQDFAKAMWSAAPSAPKAVHELRDRIRDCWTEDRAPTFSQIEMWLDHLVRLASRSAGVEAVGREITQDMMDAGQAYLDRVAFNGRHELPAQFRWVEFWDEITAVAPSEECEECSGTGHTGIDGDEVYDCPACNGEGNTTPRVDVAAWRRAMVGVPAGPWRSSPWHIEEGPSAVYVKDGWVLCPLSSDKYADWVARCSPLGIATLLDEIERLQALENGSASLADANSNNEASQ